MSLYLTLERGERLDAPNAATLQERLEANAGRTVWGPAPGRRLRTL